MSTGGVKTPVLEGLDSHNEKMQLDAFNKAHRSGGKGIGRMLGFGKGGRLARRWSADAPHH